MWGIKGNRFLIFTTLDFTMQAFLFSMNVFRDLVFQLYTMAKTMASMSCFSNIAFICTQVE